MVDSAGNVYVADTGNNAIRKITPDGTVSTITVANGVAGGLPVGLVAPSGLALIGRTLYITSGYGVVYIQNLP